VIKIYLCSVPLLSKSQGDFLLFLFVVIDVLLLLVLATIKENKAQLEESNSKIA
jgi:hypothetical protein